MKSKELFTKLKKNEIVFQIVCSILLGGLVSFVLFYIFLPPLNVHSVGFWVYLFVCALAFTAPFMNVRMIKVGKRTNVAVQNKWAFIPLLVPVIVVMVGLLISSTLFNARKYAGIIEVNEYDFAEDMPQSNEITNIALMDTDSATRFGNRVLGSLSEVVSQYIVSDYYTQINYKETPKKVSNLEYDGFFKWLGNRSTGIPGMVMVDPVNTNSEYIKFKDPIMYAESAFFGDDLERRLRFDYPTKIFHSISFEVDEECNPYYIVSCSKPQVSLFGASDIVEVIIFDPTDGTSTIMPVSDVPSWVDIVYTGELATEKYNWHGTLSGGFINSFIGNVGCKQATDDFGYIVLEDDVWYFTGVTSVVSDDKSNIGFILNNARTGEYKFYPVIGAEEHSAMGAAEGEVQEKGYVASFPSLVNVADQPTYIMVLKDAGGVVKLYALVNVENYSIVATGSTQAEAMGEYKKLLRQNNIDVGGAEQTAEIEVTEVRVLNVSGVATAYIRGSDGNIYKGYIESDESLMLIASGDRISVNYLLSDTEHIYTIFSWSFVPQP